MHPDKPPPLVTIARIVRPRGNKGEVLAEAFTDFPGRFDILQEVWIEFGDKRLLRAQLEWTWEHKRRRILKFKGYDTIGAAETLVGCLVHVPGSEAVGLPEGMYFDHDLVGCTVVDHHGNQLGVVDGILRIPGNHQLVVKDPGGKEFLIPAAESICKQISIDNKRILVDLPEGLMDLDR